MKQFFFSAVLQHAAPTSISFNRMFRLHQKEKKKKKKAFLSSHRKKGKKGQNSDLQKKIKNVYK